MNSKIAATVAVGAASTIAIERFRSRPTLAASAAAVCAAAGTFAAQEPGVVIALSIVVVVLALAV